MSLEQFLPIVATASALGVGAVAAPTLTRAFWPQPKTTYLRDRIFFDRVEPDGKTVRTLGRRGGGLFRVIALRGHIYSGKTEGDLAAMFTRRKGIFDGLAEQPVQLRILSARAHLAINPPPPQEGVAQRIDALWHGRFARSFVTEHHIVISVASESDRKRLDHNERLLLDQLHDYGPELLTLGEGDYSPLLSWLATQINGFPQIVPAQADRLSDRLSFANVEFDRHGLITYRDGPTALYSAAVGIKAWPESSTAEIINGLLRIPAPITVAMRVSPYTKEAADASIGSRAKQAKLAFYNRLISDEWKTVQEKVNAAHEAFFKTEITAYATADSPEALTEAVTNIRTSLANHAIRVVWETNLAERLWWSRLPGHDYFTRDYHLLSSNLADFTPLAAEPRGRTASQWGPQPIRFFPTASGAPYGFVFQKSTHEDLGHTLIIGPSGKGKSTLVMFLVLGALSAHPDLRAFVFDRMQGCLVPFQCFGGDYLIPESDQLPLNPFLNDDTPEHREFLRLWLQMLLQQNDDAAIEAITAAVDDMMSASPADRLMSKQWQRMFKPGDLRNAIKKWATTGKYARIFNGERDALSLTGSRLVGFDMTAMHDDPQLSASMTYYFLHRIRQLVLRQPTPHLIFIDEAPAMLKDPFFRAQVEVLFREHRKLKGVVAMGAQDPGPFDDDVFMNNTSNYIFLRNPSARREDYAKFRLTDDEWLYIIGRDRTAERLRYSALLKREGESVVLNTDLSALGGFVRAFASSIDDKTALFNLKERHGGQWLREFLPL